MHKFFPLANVESHEHIKTALDAVKHLDKKGYKKVTMMVGGDRQQEFHNLLHKYNGKEYNIPELHVKSAGERDPDSEGVEGMSASKLRDHAAKKNFSEFQKGVPGSNKAHAHELYKAVRKGMKLESFQRHFKALFLVGGPGSGKDIIIKSAFSESNILELSLDKLAKAITEQTNLEELSTHSSLIINGTAESLGKVKIAKAVLEHMGYDTAMIYVHTSDHVSKERNNERIARGVKTITESMRRQKWNICYSNLNEFADTFKNFMLFDNSNNLNEVNEETYEQVNQWLVELGERVSHFMSKTSTKYLNELYGEDDKINVGDDVSHFGHLHAERGTVVRKEKTGKFSIFHVRHHKDDTVGKYQAYQIRKESFLDDAMDQLFEVSTSAANDNSRGNINAPASDSPTENPATIISKNKSTAKILKPKKDIPGDKQTGIASSAKNMSEPPVVEEKEEPSKEGTQKFKKLKKTKTATPPPDYFDGRMGSVPSGGMGLTSSYEPKGKSLSEIRKNVLTITRGNEEE